MAEFDYVSDLHVDHWDSDYYFATQDDRPGAKKDVPFCFQRSFFQKGKPKVLVVAGDVCDDISVSIAYLKKLRRHYTHIIYIDGNHEHYHSFPNLLDTSSFKKYENMYYLGHEEPIIDKTVFIGRCGWWDYGDEYNIKSYAKQNSTLTYNILERAMDEFRHILHLVEEYAKKDNIEEIVIVTHTVPKYIFARTPNTDFNSNFEKVDWKKVSAGKLKRWIFGHNHQKFNTEKDGIHFLSNPRGRPEDYDREVYKVERSV